MTYGLVIVDIQEEFLRSPSREQLITSQSELLDYCAGSDIFLNKRRSPDLNRDFESSPRTFHASTKICRRKPALQAGAISCR